jgi:hypothetical protein
MPPWAGDSVSCTLGRMKKNRRIRITYANVVASLALFAALGGSSYAAIAVTGAQVRDGSLTGKDVHNSSLTGKDVRNASLLARDFKPGQLPAGPQGPKGDPGAPGAKGEKGDTGPAGGLKGYEIVESISPATSVDSKARLATCPAGKVAVGGGAFLLGDFSAHVALDRSNPIGDHTWEAQAQELVPVGGTWALGVKVICVNAA